MEISSEINEKIAFVSNCGKLKRVIARFGDTVHIGCFSGTKFEAEEAIRREYSGEAQADYLEKIDLLFKSKLSDFEDIHEADDFALHWSITNGHLEVAKYLIEQGANINADDCYVLRHAAENGDLNLVKFLIEKGGNVHAQDNYALRWAAAAGHLEVVQYLVEQGANVNANYEFALRRSLEKGYIELAKFLLEKGANINAADDYALRRSASNSYSVVRYYSEMLK